LVRKIDQFALENRSLQRWYSDFFPSYCSMHAIEPNNQPGENVGCFPFRRCSIVDSCVHLPSGISQRNEIKSSGIVPAFSFITRAIYIMASVSEVETAIAAESFLRPAIKADISETDQHHAQIDRSGTAGGTLNERGRALAATRKRHTNRLANNTEIEFRNSAMRFGMRIASAPALQASE